jgi:SAM-dependent methyltransferase
MYGVDLAYIHHRGYSGFAESASGWIASMLPKGLVVEVGCGSGVLARELTSAGFEVLGYDASPAMVALARDTAPAARFEVARFAEAVLPPCEAIVATGEVLNYGTFDEVRTFVSHAATALKPGGVLLFDVAERGSYPPFDEHRGGGDDFSVIAIKESDGTHLTRRVLTFRNIDGEVRRSEEVHRLELHEREAMLALLRPAFKMRVRRSYGSYRLPRGHALFLGVRRP